jgi:hypothetical protein
MPHQLLSKAAQEKNNIMIFCFPLLPSVYARLALDTILPLVIPFHSATWEWISFSQCGVDIIQPDIAFYPH